MLSKRGGGMVIFPNSSRASFVYNSQYVSPGEWTDTREHRLKASCCAHSALTYFFFLVVVAEMCSDLLT